MTESSTVTKQEDKEAPKGDQKTVPVEAVGAARAQKRAAQEEADQAKTELAKIKSSQPDMDSVIAALAAEAKKNLEQEVAPLKARLMKSELAMKMGLSEEQADKVMAVKTANPNLTEQQAVVLAKAEHADLFAPKQAGWTRGIHGGVPVGGASEARNPPQPVDNLAKMREAEAKGDKAGATHWATQEALDRYRAIFMKNTRLS